MRYTYSSNFGCLIAVLVMFIIFSFLGIISRLLFATPLGIILLVSAGVWYLMRSRENAKMKQSTFESENQDQGYEWRHEGSSPDDVKHDHNAPKREAEDVEFTEIDDK